MKSSFSVSVHGYLSFLRTHSAKSVGMLMSSIGPFRALDNIHDVKMLSGSDRTLYLDFNFNNWKKTNSSWIEISSNPYANTLSILEYLYSSPVEQHEQ